ncbi:MAG: NADH-quinone oxidoreductase subunit H [Candidatus Gastranaerophilales bacterium]|nr:NADH-quinone oxidoreductase subunit H [Candidatus Gastranaerophilales bacterium]
MIVKILNLILLLITPFLMVGLIRKTKAFWGARKGASIFQPIYDFIKLMKKDSIFSSSTTSLFKIAPMINFACIVFASLFAPMVMGQSIINIQGGLILFAYALGLSKFISLLASMETASSFEGMGSSREACFTTIIEPAFFIVIASIMALCKVYTFDSLNQVIANSGSLGILIIIFAIACLFIMLVVEGARVPVDDPATHLELTMIHEVMILDNCSQELAIISYCAAAKMFLISSLIATLILPLSLPFWASLGAFLAIMILISIIIGTIESAIARLRMSHIFEFVFVMSSLALVVASLVALKLYGV